MVEFELSDWGGGKGGGGGRGGGRRGEVEVVQKKQRKIKVGGFQGGGRANLGGVRLGLSPTVSARFSVTSGTYIRSLAEEFGRRLGVPATLAALRRTRIGEFKIEDAQALTDEAQPQP